jgi:hypothetical protein
MSSLIMAYNQRHINEDHSFDGKVAKLMFHSGRIPNFSSSSLAGPEPGSGCCIKFRSSKCQSSSIRSLPPPIPTQSHSRWNDSPCPAPRPEAAALSYAPAPALAPETQRIHPEPGTDPNPAACRRTPQSAEASRK